MGWHARRDGQSERGDRGDPRGEETGGGCAWAAGTRAQGHQKVSVIFCTYVRGKESIIIRYSFNIGFLSWCDWYAT